MVLKTPHKTGDKLNLKKKKKRLLTNFARKKDRTSTEPPDIFFFFLSFIFVLLSVSGLFSLVMLYSK